MGERKASEDYGEFNIGHAKRTQRRGFNSKWTSGIGVEVPRYT